MDTAEILIADCSEGDVLAGDVYNESGVKLVSSDTVINLFIKKQLYEQGIETIKVYHPPMKEEKRNDGSRFIDMVGYYKRSALCIRNLVNELASGERLDYEKILYVSDLIYRYVDENDNILRLIDEIRRTDEETYSHSINTAFYCMLIAKWLHLGETGIRKAVQSGFLHDIGKSRVPQGILNKKGKLTAEEYRIIKKHPVYGYDILDENRYMDLDVKRAVLLHHERLNSTGYPFIIPSDSIGVYPKIVAIADVYDAMTSNRVYKQRVSPFKSFEMFLNEGRSMFDPALVGEFTSHIAAYFIGTKVILNTGENGLIVYIPPNDILSPIVLMGESYVNFAKRKDLKIERTLC